VVEGRVAAKLAFEVIDREPKISQSSGKKHQLQGDIKLSSISFYYPTRPDYKVLRNMSVEFKKG